jgi:hypothetical protein
MAETERKDRTRFRSPEIRWMFALLAAGMVLGTVAAYASRADPGLSRIFVTGTVTLFFGSLLGGVVSLLIADFDRRRVQRAAQLEFISNVLADLKGVYDRVDRGRILITAHQSAKTYGEQMREFIDARVKLLTVLRALRFDERSSPVLCVRDQVEEMEGYLRSLTAEFQAHYKHVSRAQSLYEARMKQALAAPIPGGNGEVALPGNSPWEDLTKLPRLTDFLRPVDDCKEGPTGDASEYCRAFLLPLDRASDNLRRALDAALA